MKNRIGRGEKSLREGLISYWPEILLLCLVCVLLLCDISRKEGYHMDELLSFELANAEFTPWIVPTQPQGRLEKFVENELRKDGHFLSNLAAVVKDVLQNRRDSLLLSYQADIYEEPVWIGGTEFRNYVTVDSKDAFNYLSVYFNVKDDNHPPLHFMAIHTVSSLIRGKITPLMGCAINLVCVLGIMVLLMKIGRAVMDVSGAGRYGRVAGLAAAGLYGVSRGALSTVLLIRMYAMLTFFAVALFWIHFKKMEKQDRARKGFAQKNVGLFAVTVLGFWTQYFFLFYCLALAAVTVAFLWRQKRVRELWCYVRTMVCAAVTGVAVFPFAVADVFASGRGVEALDNLASGLDGYGTRLIAFAGIVSDGTGIVGVAVLSAALLGGTLLLGRRLFAATTADGNAGNGCRILSYLGLPPLVYYLMASRMAPYLVDRYIMLLFPFAILWGVSGLIAAGVQFGKKKSEGNSGANHGGLFMVFLLTAVQLLSGGHADNPYYYEGYKEQLALSEKYKELSCICVYEGVGYYENLPEFINYKETLLVTLEELAERRETASVTEKDAVVVLMKQNGDTERDRIVQSVLEEKYNMRLSETLMRNGAAHGDSLYVFRRCEP